MSERFAVPGFQTPDSPKENERLFGEVSRPFEVVFLKNQPLGEGNRSFDFYISLATEKPVNLLAYSKTNRFVIILPNPAGGKDYAIRIMPDELSILPGVFTLWVMENDIEIFKGIVNFRDRPIPPDCREQWSPCPLH